MKRAVVVLSLLSLTGCGHTITPQELAQQDDSVCRSYGAVPGTDAYVSCAAR
jgi:hypothetical protein